MKETVLEALKAKKIGFIGVALYPDYVKDSDLILVEIQARVNGEKFVSKRAYQLPQLESLWDVLFKDAIDEMKQAILEADI